MSRLISGALVAALLVTPALGVAHADAQPAPRAATGVGTAAAPGVEVGPLRVVMPRCGVHAVDQDIVTDRAGVSTTAFQCWSHDGLGSFVWAARTRPNGTWGPPVAIAPGLSPKMVIDGAGRVTVGYRLRHGDGMGTVRWAAGSWQAPVVLGQPKPNLHFVPGFNLAVNARGDTLIVWDLQEGCCGGPRIRFIAAFRPHDGAWGPSVIVDRKEPFGSAFLDAEGRASVLNWDLVYRRTTAGRWSSHALPAFEGDVRGTAANARGDLLLAGLDRDGAPGTLSIFEKPAGAAWLPVVELTASLAPSTTTPLVLDNLGRAALGYQGADDSFTVTTRPAGGSWQPAVGVSAAGVHAHVLRLEAGTGGALGACWFQRTPGGTEELWASIRPSGGDWSAPARLTGPRWLDLWHSAATMRPDGSLLVTWSGKITKGRAMRVSSRLVTPAT